MGYNLFKNRVNHSLYLGYIKPLALRMAKGQSDLGPYEPQHEVSNSVVYATSKGSDQPAHTPNLIRAFACRLNNR